MKLKKSFLSAVLFSVLVSIPGLAKDHSNKVRYSVRSMELSAHLSYSNNQGRKFNMGSVSGEVLRMSPNDGTLSFYEYDGKALRVSYTRFEYEYQCMGDSMWDAAGPTLEVYFDAEALRQLLRDTVPTVWHGREVEAKVMAAVEKMPLPETLTQGFRGGYCAHFWNRSFQGGYERQLVYTNSATGEELTITFEFDPDFSNYERVLEDLTTKPIVTATQIIHPPQPVVRPKF